MIELLLIVLGLVVIGVFFYAVFTMISHPADVDEEETKIVARETAAEHEHALRTGHHKTSLEESENDEKIYGPGL